MARGNLTVLICGGTNLSNPEKEGKVCVIVYYKDQQERTKAVYCDGTDPKWFEHLTPFEIDDDIEVLRVRVHDGDDIAEEEVGICDISLEGLLETGDEAEIEPTLYDVWRNGEVYGQIVVSLTFQPAEGGEDENEEEEEEEHEDE